MNFNSHGPSFLIDTLKTLNWPQRINVSRFETNSVNFKIDVVGFLIKKMILRLYLQFALDKGTPIPIIAKDLVLIIKCEN